MLYQPALRCIVCGVLALLVAGNAWASRTWLEEEDYGSLHVIVDAESGQYARDAADVFTTYWQKATGPRPDTLDAPGEGVNVWLGTGALPTRTPAMTKTMPHVSTRFIWVLLM